MRNAKLRNHLKFATKTPDFRFRAHVEEGSFSETMTSRKSRDFIKQVSAIAFLDSSGAVSTENI